MICSKKGNGMFKKLLSHFSKRQKSQVTDPMGPYLVLSWEAVNNTLGSAQVAALETLVAQVVGNSPAETHQDLVVIKVPPGTPEKLIDLATAPAPKTCH